MIKFKSRFICCEKETEFSRRREEKQMSFADIIAGLFDILEKVQNFLFSFGDIAQKFFDMLP